MNELKSFPILEVIGRNCLWRLGEACLPGGRLSSVTIDELRIAFFTDGKKDEPTFDVFIRDGATWIEFEGTIILTSLDPTYGQLEFYQG